MKDKEIHDIFSPRNRNTSNSISRKAISTPVCPNPNNPIIVDTREKNSLIAANLLEQKAKMLFKKLDIGDYLLGDICIERKTFSDFLGSMVSGRLIRQLLELKKYQKPILMLEGFYYNYSDYNIHENAIRGMITSITTEFQIPIIYTENEKDTSKYLINLAKKQKKSRQEISARPAKKLTTLEERKQFILEGFPQIGPKISKQLLKKFKTLKKILNAEKDSLLEFMDEKTYFRWHECLNK